ncbi:MAG: hypothetical protein K0R49_11 [Burkholderiales bacterium]|jgi:hypothetical protein|nr:hypothetical protein [Burkholderiales bacterium]
MNKYLSTSLLFFALITSSYATDIRILNLRARTSPAPTGNQSDYEGFFNDINAKKSKAGSTANPAYDFIGIEAYNMNKPGVNPQQSTMLKAALSNVYKNETPNYTIIGRPRDTVAEASVIAYNNKKWKLIEDSAVNSIVTAKAKSITVPNGKIVDQIKYAAKDNEIGDYEVDPAHTIQLAISTIAMYPGDYCCGTPAGEAYSRIATWGVFQNITDDTQVIYIVTHFPLGGDGVGGYDELYAKNIYNTIINPLREKYPTAPVIFSADYNHGHANSFATQNQSTLPSFKSVTFGEDGVGPGGDDMLKINFLAAYNGTIFNINTKNSLMVPSPANLDKIMAHHTDVPDVMLSTGSTPPPPATCAMPTEADVVSKSYSPTPGFGTVYAVLNSKALSATGIEVWNWNHSGASPIASSATDNINFKDVITSKHPTYTYQIRNKCGNNYSDFYPLNVSGQ